MLRRALMLIGFVVLGGCALETAAPEDTDGPAYDDEVVLESQSDALKIGPGGGGGGLGVSCSSCLDQWYDCLEDAGGDPELIEWCKWETRVCYRHCDGPIIALQR